MELSILIPSRGGEWLQRTIDDVFEHAKGDVEVIVGFDGSSIPLKPHPRLKIVKSEAHIGQRAITNLACMASEAKYVMKLDSHCSLSQGFDLALIKDLGESTVIMPCLMNLHVFDWVCSGGHRICQESKPDKCHSCDSLDFTQDVVWQVKPKPVTCSFYFDTNLMFQFCPEQSKESINETMAIQGSGFMIRREDYWRLNICDESLGSWGYQGIEVACKAWLTGGSVLCTKNAYMGHYFQHDMKNLERDEKQISEAGKRSQEIYFQNKLPNQVHSFAWLIEKFGYQGDWTLDRVKELCATK